MTRKRHPKNPRLKAIEKESKKESMLGQAIPINPGVVNEPVREKRLGWFAISAQMIDTITFEQCQEFFSHFVIIKADPDPKRPVFRYLAFSPLFEPHESRLTSWPWYDINVKLSPPDKPEGKMKTTVTATKREQKRIIIPGRGM